MQKKKPLNVAIGCRIQFSREQAGMTQEQLAEKINRSTQFVSTIERGIAGASLEPIVSLCDALCVSSEWLLRGQEPTPTADYIAAKLVCLSTEELISMNKLVNDLLDMLHAGRRQF